MLTTRRVSKQIHVGSVAVGGDARVTVQSMTKTDTRDVAATVEQIRGLQEAGCDIVRAAVPDMEAAQALAEIKRRISIPLIADIHFHYQLALESLASGVDCLRLNPGNIRDRSRVEEIVREAKARQVPIRIGVNFGSLPPVGKIGGRGTSRHLDGVNKLPKPNEAQPGDYTVVDHMVETGLWEIGILEDLDFDLIKISMKAFDIDTTVEAYRRMSEIVPYPLHLGITEAGTARSGSIRSAIGSRSVAVRGDRRHHSRFPQRRPHRRGIHGAGDPEVAGASQGGCNARSVPQLRTSRRGRSQAGKYRRQPSPTTQDSYQGGRHGV